MPAGASSAGASTAPRVDRRLFALAIVAAALSLFALTGALLPGEHEFARRIQDTPGGRRIEFFADLPALTAVQVAVLLCASGLALRARDRALAAAVLFVALYTLVDTPLKLLISRDRPAASDLLIREPGRNFGFPSGHTIAAVLIFGYATVCARRCVPPRVAVALIAAAFACVALVAWDRVYDGAHWPSDVLGGFAFGLLLLAAALETPRLVQRYRHARAAGSPHATPGEAAVGQGSTPGLR